LPNNLVCIRLHQKSLIIYMPCPLRWPKADAAIFPVIPAKAGIQLQQAKCCFLLYFRIHYRRYEKGGK
jgi:hypothetical protein